jgi:malate synthase
VSDRPQMERPLTPDELAQLAVRVEAAEDALIASLARWALKKLDRSIIFDCAPAGYHWSPTSQITVKWYDEKRLAYRAVVEGRNMLVALTKTVEHLKLHGVWDLP